MPEIFFFSDLHKGHEKIKTFRFPESPEKHDEIIKKRWNAKVNKKDTVIMPGDISFNTSGLYFLNELNGVKRGVLGNHDQSALGEYCKYFSSLHGAYEIKECIVTHFPVHESTLSRYILNIHGHLHKEIINDKRYFNVSAENIDYTPISFDEILQRIKEGKLAL